MPLEGIIDLGSNSVRLVVYDVKGHGTSSQGKTAKKADGNAPRDGGKKLFRSLLDKKKVIGLAAYVSQGKLTDEGIDKAIETMQGLIEAARNVGCDDLHVFATAVIRNCKNSKQAAKKISKAIGYDIDILSAVDEAHLGFVGATYNSPIEHGTLIDIGGGSTELTCIRDFRDTHDLSIPQGCVSSYAQFVSLILPQPQEETAIRDAFEEKLDQIDGLGDFRADHLYGIGGSVRAIDKLYAVAFSDDNRLKTLETYQVEALLSLLRENPSTYAHAATKAVPERMHSVTPGIIIACALLKRLGAQSLTVCKYGVREGYLLERVLEA